VKKRRGKKRKEQEEVKNNKYNFLNNNYFVVVVVVVVKIYSKKFSLCLTHTHTKHICEDNKIIKEKKRLRSFGAWWWYMGLG